MADTVGELKIALAFDGKTLKASLDGVEKEVESKGTKSGSKFGTAWAHAAGNLISQGISKIMTTVSSHIDDAIKRVDTLNNFPKIMSNLGVSADDAEQSIQKMSDKLQGLPTTLDAGAAAVQRFTSKNGDVKKSTDIFLALNNALLAGGQTTEIQATALEQLSQAYAKGKPDMMEWRTAMTAMPAQLNQVAEAMGFGKNASDALGEALRSGEVSMDDFMAKITEMNTEGSGEFKSFEEQAKNSTGGIQTAIAVMNSRITQGIAAVIDEIGSENIAKIAEGIGNAIKAVGKVLSGVIKFVIDNWGVIGPIIGVLGTVAGTIIAINTALTAYKAIQTAVNAITLAFNLILNANPLGLILTAIAAVVAALTYFFTQTEVGKQILQGFFDFVSAVFGGIAEFVSGVWDGITAGATAVWESIQNIFGGIAEWFGNVFRTAWEAVKAVFETGGKIFTGIVDGITNAFKVIVNGIISGINAVVAIPFNAINGFLSFLKSIDILGIKPFDWVSNIAVPQIPLLAQGGYANGATGAVIGEAGSEVVLPLSQNTDNWSGLLASALAEKFNEEDYGAGRGIVIENQNFNIDSRLDAENIGHIMMQSIRRQAR